MPFLVERNRGYKDYISQITNQPASKLFVLAVSPAPLSGGEGGKIDSLHFRSDYREIEL